ncbi:hypothetical protein M409DRAFT_48577 [Zasmidium cellare ATCC 36951]|uniref:Enoyl reductase (ER) domain-containing protein n=1 Tax=Zasmidium cellare ATCC 36951 TaxID=1080233 RepID=A0A6A6D5I7_ZASCE|nr:uncharacterized protein M409DRAFT_48577 [Zasmidium cellare ATCC 36951]KAF2173630.1 hypothetical protein M409DRAFT_48577 [Zasmidium cellare ATCC 36951]
MATHLAAVAPAMGAPFEIQSRPTPKPGPGDVLVQVKSVALNPADHIMRDLGIHIPEFPAIIGFDISGVILEVGENVPSANDQGSGPAYQPGTRVAAYAAAAFKSCDPDYGAFQEKVLVPWEHVAPIPAEGISWNEAATLPVAIQVPLSVWDALGIPRSGGGGGVSSSKKPKKEALLIWGASSSVGTGGVQSAKLMKEDGDSPFAAVYATAGAANQKYINSLGADRVFDYKDPNVVDSIISAAKEDGVIIRYCYLAMGQLAQCQAVLKAFAGDSHEKAKIGSAPPLPEDAEAVDGVEAMFVIPAMEDEEQRLAQFRYWIATWLREKLASGQIKPSPEPTVVGRGLDKINTGLSQLQKGVSCTKLVIEVGE